MLTTVQVRSETKDRMKLIGQKGESYDTIINRLLDEHECPRSVASRPDVGVMPTTKDGREQKSLLGV